MENCETIKPTECSEFEALNKLFDDSLGNRTHFNGLYYTIRRLQVHFDECCVNIAELNTHNNIDIIVPTETWNLSYVDCCNITGFHLFYNGVNYNNCDGAAMYVREDILGNISVEQLMTLQH
nr:unnamed protein product [Callosobruchus analis]